jgi:hypothetical protein
MRLYEDEIRSAEGPDASRGGLEGYRKGVERIGTGEPASGHRAWVSSTPIPATMMFSRVPITNLF